MKTTTLFWTFVSLLSWNESLLHHCCSAWSNPAALEVDRRRALAALGKVGAFLGTAIGKPQNALAVAPVNPSEAVRRGAANIPGYGQTDVFYPAAFAGNWKAVRELLPSGLTLEYPVRFVTSIEDTAVVADRGWNQANLEKALRQVKDNNQEALLPSYTWAETNPNDLRIKFADGKVKDIKVTKRATERTEETVFSSEFQRVTQDDSRGIPVITARRVMSKWKVLDSSTIEAMEVVYDAGGGDPLAGANAGGDQNKILSKSRIRLERQ